VNLARTLGLPAALALTMGVSVAQDAAHDVDQAGMKTGHAVRNVGKKIGKGTKTSAKDVGHGTRVAAKDSSWDRSRSQRHN
jgi:hypothetical protein